MDSFGGASIEQAILIDDSDEYGEEKWAQDVDDVKDKIDALEQASKESSMRRERSEEQRRRDISEEQLRQAQYNAAVYEEEERRRRLQLPAIPITPQHRNPFARPAWGPIMPSHHGGDEDWVDISPRSEESQMSPKRQCTSHPRADLQFQDTPFLEEHSQPHVDTEEDLQRLRELFMQPDPTQHTGESETDSSDTNSTDELAPQRTALLTSDAPEDTAYKQQLASNMTTYLHLHLPHDQDSATPPFDAPAFLYSLRAYWTLNTPLYRHLDPPNFITYDAVLRAWVSLHLDLAAVRALPHGAGARASRRGKVEALKKKYAEWRGARYVVGGVEVGSGAVWGYLVGGLLRGWGVDVEGEFGGELGEVLRGVEGEVERIR